MEILPTLASMPGASPAPEAIASGSDDPFLALLAGLMQQPAQPAAPLPGEIQPAAGTMVKTPAGPGQALAALPPASPVAISPMPDPLDATGVGITPPNAGAAPHHEPLREPLAAAGPGIDLPSSLPVAGEAAPASPPSPGPDAKGNQRLAETASLDTIVRPKSLPVVQRREPHRPGEREAISADRGEVPEMHAVAAIVPPPNIVAANEALARSPDPDATDLAAQALEAGAAAVPAAARQPADAPAAQGSAPVQLPTPDHRGRPVTARLVVVDGIEGSRVRIDLEPADLGRVEVALRLDESGAAAASFIVDRPETLQLLQRDARAVNEMLTAAGFTVDQGGVDFALRDPDGRDGGAGRHPGTRGRAEAGSSDDAAPSEPAPIYRHGLLDLRV